VSEPQREDHEFVGEAISELLAAQDVCIKEVNRDSQVAHRMILHAGSHAPQD